MRGMITMRIDWKYDCKNLRGIKVIEIGISFIWNPTVKRRSPRFDIHDLPCVPLPLLWQFAITENIFDSLNS